MSKQANQQSQQVSDCQRLCNMYGLFFGYDGNVFELETNDGCTTL